MAREKQTSMILKEMRRYVVLAGLVTGMIAFAGCGSTSTRNSTNDDIHKENMASEPSIEDSLQEGSTREYWLESEVDEKPQFPGGDEGMKRFFDKCYRKEKNLIIGMATVGYLVNANGKIEWKKIIEGDSLLGEQLIRIISQFPDYLPGKLNGKPVDVLMTYSMSNSLHIGAEPIPESVAPYPDPISPSEGSAEERVHEILDAIETQYIETDELPKDSDIVL